MKFLPQIRFGLTAKLTILIETLIVLLVVVTGVISTLREKESLENELRKRGLAVAADLATITVRPLLLNDLPQLRRFINHSMEQDYVRYVMILDPHAKVIMHSSLDEVGRSYRDQLSFAAVQSELSGCSLLLRDQGEHYYDVFVPVQLSGVRLGTVRLGYSYTAVEQEVAKAREQILTIGLVTAAIGYVFSPWLFAYIQTHYTGVSHHGGTRNLHALRSCTTQIWRSYHAKSITMWSAVAGVAYAECCFCVCGRPGSRQRATAG